MTETDLHKNRFITRDFLLFMLTAGFIFMSGSMINTPLPKYILSLGGSGSLAGFVTGLFALSSCLLRPVFGHLLDRIGRLPILMFGIVINSLVVLSYSLTDAIPVLLFFRFLHGIALSAYSTSFGTIVADLTPPNRLVEGYGYYSILQTIANSAGPVIGLGLIVSGNYNTLFYLAAAVSGAGIVSAAMIRYERDRKKGITAVKQLSHEQQAGVGRPSRLIEKNALAIMVTALFMSITFGAVLTFLSPLAAERGIENIGIYFTFNAVTVFLMRIFLGRLTSRLGTVRLVFIAFASLFVSMVILFTARSIPVFIVAAVLNGLGFGALHPLLNSMAVRACPPERKGGANATFYIGIDIGAGVGSVAGGLLADAYDYSAPFAAAAVFAVAAAVVFGVIVRRQIEKNPQMDLAKPVKTDHQ